MRTQRSANVNTYQYVHEDTAYNFFLRKKRKMRYQLPLHTGHNLWLKRWTEGHNFYGLILINN